MLSRARALLERDASASRSTGGGVGAFWAGCRHGLGNLDLRRRLATTTTWRHEVGSWYARARLGVERARENFVQRLQFRPKARVTTTGRLGVQQGVGEGNWRRNGWSMGRGKHRDQVGELQGNRKGKGKGKVTGKGWLGDGMTSAGRWGRNDGQGKEID